MKPVWRREQVEDVALLALLDFRRRTGLPLRPPIDVDLVGEIVGGLSWDWDVLPEPPQTIIWAGLFPEEKRVVLNERHVEEFRRKRGLERFTKAHELGHWLLHVLPQDANQSTLTADALPQSTLKAPPHFWSQDSEKNTSNTFWIERHADWFAGALLMPANLLVPLAEAANLHEWKSLYQLAAQFDVTISALCVRLSHLKFSHIAEQKSSAKVL